MTCFLRFPELFARFVSLDIFDRFFHFYFRFFTVFSPTKVFFRRVFTGVFIPCPPFSHYIFLATFRDVFRALSQVVSPLFHVAFSRLDQLFVLPEIVSVFKDTWPNWALQDPFLCQAGQLHCPHYYWQTYGFRQVTTPEATHCYINNDHNQAPQYLIKRAGADL
jgi:hypothetical protein